MSDHTQGALRGTVPAFATEFHSYRATSTGQNSETITVLMVTEKKDNHSKKYTFISEKSHNNTDSWIPIKSANEAHTHTCIP